MIEELWDDLAGEVGPGSEKLLTSLSQLYTIYPEKLISWFANLYDPGIGGYYYSNSARNTEGYLPDADSTFQALSFISGSGMGYTEIDGFRSYSELLPEWMKEQIVSFIKGLQNPNGYFYHPQWGVARQLTKRSQEGRCRRA